MALTDLLKSEKSRQKESEISISEADENEVVIQPEADIIPVFGGNVL